MIYSSVRIYMLQYWVKACNCPSNKANSNVLFRSKKLILTWNCTSSSFAKRKQFFDVLTCYEIWLSFLGGWKDFVERTSLPHFELDVLMSSWHVVLNFVILSDVRLLTAYLSQQTKLSSADEPHKNFFLWALLTFQVVSWVGASTIFLGMNSSELSLGNMLYALLWNRRRQDRKSNNFLKMEPEASKCIWWF